MGGWKGRKGVQDEGRDGDSDEEEEDSLLAKNVANGVC